MLFYKAVQKANPRKLDEPNKYFAAAVNSGEANYRDLINAMAKNSTVSTPDVLAVIESLFEVIPEFLEEGKIVRLGELGSFTILLQSEGQERKEDVNIHTIKGNRIRFIPSKELKRKLRNIHYGKFNAKKSG